MVSNVIEDNFIHFVEWEVHTLGNYQINIA